MQSAIPSSSVFTPTSSQTVDWRLGIPTYVYAVVFSSLCIVWGLLWDIMWHMSIGRDGLFSAPHLLIYAGAVVSGLFSGFKILQMTLQRTHPERLLVIRFWGVFYSSLGALYCVWGALAMLTSAPFDDWWHNTYGLDVQILTPPHTVLVLGMMFVQFGAMIGVLAIQNRYRDQTPDTVIQQRQANRLKLLFAITAGLLLAVLFTLFSEGLSHRSSHRASFYVISAIIYPFYLLAVGRASLLRYPLTTITLVYLLTMLIPSWILPLFPATPKLGPVMNPITHYQPFVFPHLLVIPGFILDKLMHRFDGKLNDWLLAALTGSVFVLILLAVQWNVGEFTLTSPYARNWFFLSESWSYGNDPNWEYRYKFHEGRLESTAVFLKRIGLALVYAFISARIGLFWGNWMKRVQR